MAAAVLSLPLEEYLKTAYEPDADFINGDVEERNVGEFQHSRLQSLLLGIFLNHEPVWDVIGVVEQRIRVSESRVRVADLAILRAETPREAVVTTPPLICIEVMSPEDRIDRARLVLEDYRAMGVANLWLIDPLRRVVFSYDGELRIESSAVLEVPGTPIRVEVEPLFARLD